MRIKINTKWSRVHTKWSRVQATLSRDHMCINVLAVTVLSALREVELRRLCLMGTMSSSFQLRRDSVAFCERLSYSNAWF